MIVSVNEEGSYEPIMLKLHVVPETICYRPLFMGLLSS